MQQNKSVIGIYLKLLDVGYQRVYFTDNSLGSLQLIFMLLIPQFTYNRITCLENVNHLSFSKFAGFHFFLYSNCKRALLGCCWLKGK